MHEKLEGQVAVLSSLLQLQKQIREIETPQELSFAAVNDTRLLVEYRQAALWNKDTGEISVSGLPNTDKNSPYIHWLRIFFNNYCDCLDVKKVSSVDSPKSLSTDWGNWLPHFAIIIPLKPSVKSDKCSAYLMLAREGDFYDHEIALLEESGGIYGSALNKLTFENNLIKKIWHSFKSKPGQFSITVLLIGALFIPLRLSVLAPAEIAPRDSVLIRSPLAGVIDKFHVRPNDIVEEGQLLFDLDSTTLRNQLDIARKSMQVAEAEYRRTQQKAVFDQNSKMDLSVHKMRVEEKAAEVQYYTELLNRVRVTALKAGIAVFTDIHDWIGRSVVVGEKVLSIADPEKVEVIIQLPMAEIIPLKENADMKLFLNIAPNRPYSGKIKYISYRAKPTSEGILSYKVKGRLAENEHIPRIGLSGTAKIYGGRTIMFYYLFRRPMAAFKQWLGI